MAGPLGPSDTQNPEPWNSFYSSPLFLIFPVALDYPPDAPKYNDRSDTDIEKWDDTFIPRPQQQGDRRGP